MTAPATHDTATDQVTGIPSFGTQIQVWTGTEFVSVAGVGDISGPSTSVGEVDTTSHSTGSPHRTSIPTLIDDGELSFPNYWNPADPTQSPTSIYGLEYLFQNRIISKFRMINTDPGHRTREFKAFVKTLGESYPVEGVCTKQVSLRISGKPVDVASPIVMEPVSASATAVGGADSFDVTTGGIMTEWVAVSDAAWITVDAAAPVSGDGTVDYTVAAQSPAAPARTGHIVIAALGLSFTIDQAVGV